MSTTVRALLKVSHRRRNISWLQRMLRVAIKLELATIPPYLCAYWSINEHPPGYIRSSFPRVVGEEMRHLGLACNLLAACYRPDRPKRLPILNRPGYVPIYPGYLPGNIHPGLKLSLSKLNKEQIGNQFMQLEFPSKEAVAWGVRSFSTIGDFYQAIRQFVSSHTLPYDTHFQREINPEGFSSIVVTKIRDPDQALIAIDQISGEGEGAHASPFVIGPDGNEELAHYYQFAEMFWQRQIVRCGDDGWGFCGDRIDWPEQIYDMAEVPPGGYHTADAYLFDTLYTQILDLLTAAWNTYDAVLGQTYLQRAISTMKDTTPNGFASVAIRLMQTPRRFGRGNYGPCFRLQI